MSYPLDPIIAKVNSDTKEKTAAEKIVRVNMNFEKQKGGLKSLISRKEYNYYRVANISDARNHVLNAEGPTCHIRDFNTNHALNIIIFFRAHCPVGNEEKVAEALKTGTHPGLALNDLIEKWVLEFTEGNESAFIEDYDSKCEELNAHIHTRSEGEVGLELKSRVKLERELELKTEKFNSIKLPVRVKDFNEEFNLHIKTEVHVDEDNKVKAHLHLDKLEKLESRIKKATRLFFEDNVTTQELYTELNGAIEKNLIDHLNKDLANEGRRIAYFSMESIQINKFIEGLEEFEISIPFKPNDYPDSINIKNRLQLLPKDFLRYKIAHSPDPSVWSRNKLDLIIKELLFETKYVDLFDFPPIRDAIKKRMEQEITAIGYDIKHIVSAPELKPLEYLEDFTFEVENTYATKNARVDVKLGIAITARFETLSDIQTYLSPQIDIPELLRKDVINKVRQLLHTVDPGRFYMKFSYGGPDAQSVESEIDEVVRGILIEKYKLKIVSVTPKILDNELTSRFARLEGKIQPFEVELKSLRGGESIQFSGTFHVERVSENGWHTFQVKKYGIDEVKGYLESSLSSWLEALDDGKLRYSSVNHLTELLKTANEIGVKSVRKAFGLEINIDLFSRKRTKLEEYAAEVDQEIQYDKLGSISERVELLGEARKSKRQLLDESNKAKLSNFKKLQGRRDEILSLDENEEELSDVTDQIDDILEDTSLDSIDDLGDELNNLTSDTLYSKFELENPEKGLLGSGDEEQQESEEEDE